MFFQNLTNDKIYVIAEGCDNHMGNFDVAIEMCRLAKLAGADAIKFQHHLPYEEMLPDVPLSDNFDVPLFEFLLKNSLSLDEHIKISSYCKSISIEYLCTPFSTKAAYQIRELVRFFKIGSGELLDYPSLREIAKIGKPLLLSTGMSTLDEIIGVYNFLKPIADVGFLNCISEYPPIYEDMNLMNIRLLMNTFPDLVIGHSDHSPDLYTSFAAAALGATIIEKHVIIDKRTPGPDQSVSIDFNELHQLVDGVRKIKSSLGDKKIINPREMPIRAWAHRSVVTTVDIDPGETLTMSNIWTKRPGTGIPAIYYDEIVGKRAKQRIGKDTILEWDMFE